MNKKALLDKRTQLLAENQELNARLSAGELNTEELGRIDTIMTELEAVNADLEKLEAAEKRLKAAQSRPGATVHDRREDAEFGSHGEFYRAVYMAGSSNYENVDPRLRRLAPSGLNEGVGAEGGFLVREDWANDLFTKGLAAGAVARLCKAIPISTEANGTVINGVAETSRVNGSRAGGVQAYWAAEAATVTATKPSFDQVRLRLDKLMALVYATDEQLADAPQLAAWINSEVPEEIGFKLDDAIIRGNGTGVPLGVLNADCLVSVAKEGSQTATTFNFANASKMFSRMWARSLPKARWFINQDVYPQLLQLTSAASSAATPMFIEPGRISDAPNGLLFGRPVDIIEQCDTLGQVGDVIFADFGQYLLARKGGITGEVSMHVRFIYGEQTFRFTLRADGRPRWKSALTPYKGSNTVSPFIALAVRS